MAITRDIVRHTAELARLDLDVLGDAEVAELEEQLGAILEYVAQLEALDTDGVEPTTHAVWLPIPLREDVPLEGPGRERILANAPRVDDGYFIVPRVIE